jgi:enoyl-CoA hydratase
VKYDTIRLEINGRKARLTLAGPETGNRIDARMLVELQDAAAVLAEQQSVNVIVFEAEGDDFSLGWEKALKADLVSKSVLTVDPFGPIAALAPVTVAAMRGCATSAGLELALCCDIRIAAADAVFQLPEVIEGILPLAGGTQRLPRIAGRAAATEMILLGQEIDSARALRCGLVSRVVPSVRLDAEASAISEAIASRGPLAVRYAKEAALRGAEMTLEQGLRFEADLSVILQTTEDRAEGVRAFLEKRPPRFEGR